MELIEYTALIRTYNSEETLPQTLMSLEDQTHVPSAYIFVDSGSTDHTLDLVPLGSILHKYVGGEFNYSASLNQGIKYVDTPYVLIVSSHTAVLNRGAMAFAMSLLSARSEIGAAYFGPEETKVLGYDVIDRGNFTGFNGVWNTCAVIRTSLLRKRPFKLEVFSAEDQEWSRWLLETENGLIARVTGAQVNFNNPRKHLVRKRLNEYLAVALFVKPEMLHFPYIFRVCYRIIRPVSTISERIFNIRLLFNLVICRFGGRQIKSRYF